LDAAQALVVCDGAAVPVGLSDEDWSFREELRSSGPDPNLHLYGDNAGQKGLTTITGRFFDLIRIASYVYAADQQLQRFAPKDVYGERWRRQITLCLPVVDPDFWAGTDILRHLRDVLLFATDDDWQFHFDEAPPESRQLVLFTGPEELAAFGDPDSVALFSGGADSLCAAIEQTLELGRKPILVSHTSTLAHEGRQRRLLTELRRQLTGWSPPHVRFPISRAGSDAADTSQRSRPFLFASLGAAVAAQLGLTDVFLPDNGIVSLNLFASRVAPGAMASRSTHPRFIALQRLRRPGTPPPGSRHQSAVVPHAIRGAGGPPTYRSRAAAAAHALVQPLANTTARQTPVRVLLAVR